MGHAPPKPAPRETNREQLRRLYAEDRISIERLESTIEALLLNGNLDREVPLRPPPRPAYPAFETEELAG